MLLHLKKVISVRIIVLFFFYHYCDVQSSLTELMYRCGPTRQDLWSWHQLHLSGGEPEPSLCAFTFLPNCCIFQQNCMHTFLMLTSSLCCLRLACWPYVRTGISSWLKTSRKLTRRSSKRMSRSTSSTNRERNKYHPGREKGVQTLVCLLIYIRVSVSALCLGDSAVTHSHRFLD